MTDTRKLLLKAADVAALAGYASDLVTVSHGNPWSIYFRDSAGNRLELFVDMPSSTQPCRFEIDLPLPDAALAAATEARIRDLPGFRRRARRARG